MARPTNARIARLARRHGILIEFVDASGRRRRAPTSTLVALLRALGVSPNDRDGSARRDDEGPGGSASVCVIDPLHRATSIRTPGASSLRGELQLEGKARSTSVRTNRDGTWQLPRRLPSGIHTLRYRANDRDVRIYLIAAPARLPPPEGSKRWGIFVPVYALRDHRTWGCGDFRALEAVGAWAARHGATVLSTLPLLPAFLDDPLEPSPYRAVSRSFRNELFLDPTATPEFRRSRVLRRRIRTTRFRRRVARLERRPHVDFRAVARLKREVVEQLLREFARAPPARRRAYRRFLARTPDIDAYARFRAEREPKRRDAEEYHRFVQWLTAEQLEHVVARLRRRGIVLALDLPIGTHPDGFDASRDRAILAPEVQVGSPPDPGVPAGQNWGMAPYVPEALRRVGYAPLVRSLQHELSVSRILRIDHVLGVHRLFWIPAGQPARRGAYVRYPVQELYAVVLSEASRVGATIIGEDLGTVPPEVRPEMRRRGLLGMYVAELEWDGPGRPRLIPRASAAMLNTHDHLPFAGYWARRPRSRVAARGRERGFPSGSTPVREALQLSLERLARSRATLLIVNLEDAWGETQPQNVPGTQGANFSRRFRRTIEAFTHDSALNQWISTIDALRRGRYARWPHRPAPAHGRPARARPPGRRPHRR
jgi:4-alpha-glucanotransferase